MPDFTLVIAYQEKILELTQNSATEYGEPQIWLNLSDEKSLEITHETNGLAEDEQFYSIRVHCSQKDFDSGSYQSTCGILETVVCSTIENLANRLEAMLCQLHTNGVDVII